MNNHEKLVREIAEEMAKAKSKKFEPTISWEQYHVEAREWRISDHLPDARIAVKHMANAFSTGYGEGAKWGMSFYVNGRMKTMMTERGLIPESGKEAAGDESKNS
ncbi:hypothetical protein [Chitinophaga varians]|uniref:hypothetical protein n=1 Tax=Chitinophaga varians TaxID=2202339 RepID=UPI00165EEEE9|nr:hypothetical protein [Chitinophaga varians]MBC9913139.1 hypothetical protein [Chitinophaga varians]